LDREEWQRLLKRYRSPKRVAQECIEGLEDQLKPCRKGKKHSVVTRGAGSRNVPPFHEELTVCSRGSLGCDLAHNDEAALKFALDGFNRILDLSGTRRKD